MCRAVRLHRVLRAILANMNSWLKLLRLPHLAAQAGIDRDIHAAIRLNFLHAACASGLLRQLRQWKQPSELVPQFETLDAMLDVGVALGELKRDGNRYRISGRRALTLAGQGGDSLAALIEEFVTFHAAVYRDFGDLSAHAGKRNYLAGKGELIARSSRVLEPFMVEFVQSQVAGKGPLSLLEVGCGSGIYLRHAACANPQATGIGIDLEKDVIAEICQRLVEWGIAPRFRVLYADIRQPGAETTGPFDLITLYNNIYYFPENQRVRLLVSLRERLKPGGKLAVVSLFAGTTVTAANFELVLRSTIGCAPMGTVENFVRQLYESGFREVTTIRLIPVQPFFGVTASP
jgi:4-hydroxy-2,2'-bipyrrole-5-carbaldehyde O-methyltransferase